MNELTSERVDKLFVQPLLPLSNFNILIFNSLIPQRGITPLHETKREATYSSNDLKKESTSENVSHSSFMPSSIAATVLSLK